MSKKLSIAIPTYNRVPYLKECVQSVLNQTFQDFSVFVFDNASTEPVEEEVKKFNDNRIHFIGNEKNIGFEGNVNRILQYPFESEYVIIFHDDDTMHPKMLELETSFLDAHQDVVFVVSDLQRGLDNSMQAFPSVAEDTIQHVIYKNSYEFVRAQMSWLRYGFDSAMYRIKDVGDAQLNPERFSDFADMALLAEISKKGPCAFIAALLMNHRIHPGQYSESLKKDYVQGAMNLLSFYRESLPCRDKKLFCKYSINFLLRTYAHINNGFLDFLRFMKRCRQKKLIKYSYFRYIDMRGIVSIISIIFKNKKIFDAARWLRNIFVKSQ